MIKFYVRMLLAAMLFIPSVAFADDVTVLQVNYNDGSSVNFAFTDSPAFSFKADSIDVTSSSSSLQTVMSEVKDFKFVNVTTGINAIENGAQVSGGQAFLSNLSDGEAVRVYSISGKLVLSTKAEGGNAQLDLAGLGRGIYIIRTAKTSTKVIIK